MQPRDIAKELNVSHSSVHRIIKIKVINQFKSLKSYINDTIGTDENIRYLLKFITTLYQIKNFSHRLFFLDLVFYAQIFV